MRRVPASLLVLTPLALALLYVGAYAVLAPRPDLDDVVPRMAVLTARFRGVENLDRHWPFDRPEGVRVSETLAAARNVEGLPGVDRSGPIHFVLLPKEARSDPTLLILPVTDADALTRRFEGRDVPPDDPRGLQRHAQHLEVRGDFAALAWDREAVRHLGEGGVTCADRGEDFALAADVPGLVAFALSNAGQPPWRGLVEALGGEPGKAETKVDPVTGARRIEFPLGRVARLAETWRTARFWAWKGRREIEVELEPADGALAADLRAAHGEVATAAGQVPASALAWLEVHGVAGRRTLARALHGGGVKGVEGLFGADPGARTARTLKVWALANAAEGHGWTLVVAGVDGTLPSLAPLLPTLPEPGSPQDLPAGAAPITLSDTRWAGGSPAGKVVALGRRASPDAPAVVTGLAIGADAERVEPGLERPAPEQRAIAALPETGSWRTLARFGLAPQRQHDVLGRALGAGGILSVLAEGGGIEGDVSTDGKVLRVRVRAMKP